MTMLCYENRFRKCTMHRLHISVKNPKSKTLPSFGLDAVKRGDLIEYDRTDCETYLSGNYGYNATGVWDGNKVRNCPREFLCRLRIHKTFSWPEFPIGYFDRITDRYPSMSVRSSFKKQWSTNISILCPIKNKRTSYLHSWISAPMDLHNIYDSTKIPLDLINLIGQYAGEILYIVGPVYNPGFSSISTIDKFVNIRRGRSVRCADHYGCSCKPPKGDRKLYICRCCG